MTKLHTTKNSQQAINSFETRKNRNTLSRGTMVSDVCLVVVWAASIPGLMWLGAAGGF